ncbi:MAG: gas vesicle protein [Bacillota bacterium]
MSTITKATEASNLVDILERVLDKGVVIAGDIKISLADVDLLTIKIRLLVASVDRAREMGINWWEHDPYLTVRSPQTVNGETHPGEVSNNAGYASVPQTTKRKACTYYVRSKVES